MAALPTTRLAILGAIAVAVVVLLPIVLDGVRPDDAWRRLDVQVLALVATCAAFAGLVAFVRPRLPSDDDVVEDRDGAAWRWGRWVPLHVLCMLWVAFAVREATVNDVWWLSDSRWVVDAPLMCLAVGIVLEAMRVASKRDGWRWRVPWPALLGATIGAALDLGLVPELRIDGGRGWFAHVAAGAVVGGLVDVVALVPPREATAP